MKHLRRAGLSISGSEKPIRLKPAPTNQLVPFMSNANPIGITLIVPTYFLNLSKVFQNRFIAFLFVLF
jgi:hypothetical protein